MGVEVGRDDNDITEIDEQRLSVQPTKDLFHESLEGGQCGRMSERQHFPFPEPIPHKKHGLVLCFRTQEHLPIPA